MQKRTFPIPHIPKPGHNEDFDFTTKQGAVSSIQVNTKKVFTKEDTIRHLKRLKSNINSQKCKAVDSETIGDKYTHCNWGLCTNDPNVYSEPKDHTFPYDYMNHGRVSPLRHPTSCPMDKREDSSRMGCFYHCRIFQGPRPKKEEALKLVQIKIDTLQE